MCNLLIINKIPPPEISERESSAIIYRKYNKKKV